MLLFVIAIFAAFASTYTLHYNTMNRQVYASWTVCDGCNCNYFLVYAFEHTTQNPDDTTPAVYLFYNHEAYDNCIYTYKADYLQSTDPVIGLEISRSGRSAEVVINNMTDSSNHTVSINLSWPTADSDNIGNCNCRDIYSYGTESVRINSRSSFRMAQLTGSITIDGVIHIPPADSYSFISGRGQKTLLLQHH